MFLGSFERCAAEFAQGLPQAASWRDWQDSVRRCGAAGNRDESGSGADSTHRASWADRKLALVWSIVRCSSGLAGDDESNSIAVSIASFNTGSDQSTNRPVLTAASAASLNISRTALNTRRHVQFPACAAVDRVARLIGVNRLGVRRRLSARRPGIAGRPAALLPEIAQRRRRRRVRRREPARVGRRADARMFARVPIGLQQAFS